MGSFVERRGRARSKPRQNMACQMGGDADALIDAAIVNLTLDGARLIPDDGGSFGIGDTVLLRFSGGDLAEPFDFQGEVRYLDGPAVGVRFDSNRDEADIPGSFSRRATYRAGPMADEGPLEVEVRCVAGETRWYRARLVDLSTSGMRLELDARPGTQWVGQAVVLRLATPPSTQPAQIFGTVRNASSAAEGRFRYGISFDWQPHSESTRREIESYVVRRCSDLASQWLKVLANFGDVVVT